MCEFELNDTPFSTSIHHALFKINHKIVFDYLKSRTLFHVYNLFE